MVLTTAPFFHIEDLGNCYPSVEDMLFEMFAPQSYQPHVVLKRTKPVNCRNQCVQQGKSCKEQEKKLVEDEAKTPTAVVPSGNNFKVEINVKDFKPEEITVKMINDKVLSIEARHEENDDENGYILHHVLKKFTVPEGFDVDQLKSKLTMDGTLAITAPRIIQEEKKPGDDKIIPIQFFTENM